MSNTNNGGSAFPHEYFDAQLGQARSMTGMTLRDYFAAKAMQAMLSSPNCPKQVEESTLAAASYTTADAMLKAREEK